MSGSVRSAQIRKKQILAFLREYRSINGFSPSIREIAAAVGKKEQGGVPLSTSVANYHLHALEREGLILRNQSVCRSILLADEEPSDYPRENSELIKIPIIGRLTAYSPIPNFEPRTSR